MCNCLNETTQICKLNSWLSNRLCALAQKCSKYSKEGEQYEMVKAMWGKCWKSVLRMINAWAYYVLNSILNPLCTWIT